MADAPLELDELKAQLAREVSAKDTDFGAILKLAAEISRQQPGVVRFAADAALVRRLGRELVAKQETALGELVKNAYDADAETCTVNLIAEPGVTGFDIVDDGNGMTYTEIANGFMRLASDEKVVHPVSPRYGRSRAGKKGIGRFATERLGEQLTIVTQTEHEAHGWTMHIDWSDFIQGVDIGMVVNSIARSEKERPRGTRLSIRGLRDHWTDADLKRVYRYLATLIQPAMEGLHPPLPVADAKPVESDPSFIVEIRRGWSILDTSYVVANADTEVLGNALAVITARIDDSGRATWGMTCKRFDIALTDQQIGPGKVVVVPLKFARNVQMRAYYYIRASEFLGHSTSAIGAVLDERGGIRLYRNGYRVPPYGERDDDWLGLDAKRTNTYAPINSKTFLGFVAVEDREGRDFEETSSREGLIASDALEEVRNVMSQVLEAAVRRIESKRGLGRKPRERRARDSGGRAAQAIEQAVEGIRDALDGASKTEDADARSGQVDAAVERLALAAREIAEVAQERDEYLQEVNLMRILASMGLTMAEFTHDFSHLAETMELNLNALATIANQQTPEYQSRMDTFRNQFRQVRAYTSHFGSMLANNAARELKEIDLYEFVRLFAKDLAVMFEKRGLELNVERPSSYDLRTIPMHASEWSSILLNLLTNSIKAAARAGRAGRFLVQLGRSPEGVFLDFSDNGDGIPDENRAQIFDAFFTTGGGSAARAPEAVQAIGTGLGLKIVSDIAAAAGGTVAVIDPASGYSTSIRVTVPCATTPLEASI